MNYYEIRDLVDEYAVVGYVSEIRYRSEYDVKMDWMNSKGLDYQDRTCYRAVRVDRETLERQVSEAANTIQMIMETFLNKGGK